jgi:hypothetical protein
MHAIELGIFDPSAKDQAGLPLTVRSVFIVNPRKEIALTMTYPSTVGRNFDEILRVVDALQRADEFHVATPANWQPGDKVIVAHNLNDDDADNMFGKDGCKTVTLPSETGRELKKHYLRYTDDPVLTRSGGKQSLKLAMRIKPKLSWRPPKSFALTMFKQNKKHGSAMNDAQGPSTTLHQQKSELMQNDSATDNRHESLSSLSDSSRHITWKTIMQKFGRPTSLSSERVESATQNTRLTDVQSSKSTFDDHELLVGFGAKDSVFGDESRIDW